VRRDGVAYRELGGSSQRKGAHVKTGSSDLRTVSASARAHPCRRLDSPGGPDALSTRLMDQEPTRDIVGTLEGLQSTLEAALHLTRELTEDTMLCRWLGAFRAIPSEDRAVVVEAIERELKARALSRATEDVTGQSMVPNPHARLYVRAHESTFDRNLLERDEMMIATVRGMRVASIIPNVPDIHASWQAATREALEHVDAETRKAVERLVCEVLEMLRAVDVPGSDAGPPSSTVPASGTRARER
jgi:hypothetical protein